MHALREHQDRPAARACSATTTWTTRSRWAARSGCGAASRSATPVTRPWRPAGSTSGSCEARVQRRCGLARSTPARTAAASRFGVSVDEPPYSVAPLRGAAAWSTSPRGCSAERAARESTARATGPRTRPKEHGYADYRKDEPLYLKTYRLRGWTSRCATAAAAGKRARRGLRRGLLPARAARARLDVWGVEPSAPIARYAQRRTSAADSVHVGHARHGRLRDGAAFDLVTLWDVVEHVPEPREPAARRRARCSGPDGLLVIETQNVDSRFARLLGRAGTTTSTRSTSTTSTRARRASCVSRPGSRSRTNTPRYGGKYVSLGLHRRARGARPPDAGEGAHAARAARAVRVRERDGRDDRPGHAAPPPELAVDEVASSQFVELEESHFWFIGRRRIFFACSTGTRGPPRPGDPGRGLRRRRHDGPALALRARDGPRRLRGAARVCRRAASSVVLAATPTSCPPRRGSVDLIPLFDTIEHIPDDVRVLRGVRRALSPAAWCSFGARVWVPLRAERRIVHHQRRYTARRARAMKLRRRGALAGEGQLLQHVAVPRHPARRAGEEGQGAVQRPHATRPTSRTRSRSR